MDPSRAEAWQSSDKEAIERLVVEGATARIGAFRHVGRAGSYRKGIVGQLRSADWVKITSQEIA